MKPIKPAKFHEGRLNRSKLFRQREEDTQDARRAAVDEATRYTCERGVMLRWFGAAR